MILNLRKLRSHPAYHKLAGAGRPLVGGVLIEVDDKLAAGLRDLPVEEAPKRSSVVVRKPVEWPAWARTIAAQRADGDRGIGDTAERLFGAVGGELFKRAIALAGIDCGCSARKDSWNSLYPY